MLQGFHHVILLVVICVCVCVCVCVCARACVCTHVHAWFCHVHVSANRIPSHQLTWKECRLPCVHGTNRGKECRHANAQHPVELLASEKPTLAGGAMLSLNFEPSSRQLWQIMCMCVVLCQIREAGACRGGEETESQGAQFQFQGL